MSEVDFNTVKRVHMIGVGGIGMSALARLFVHEKKEVSGSDRARSVVTEGLEALGVRVAYEQVPANISDDIELVVYTSAMPDNHPELHEARRRHIPTMTYFEALGACVNPYYLIAVAGTHGKTTTTAMMTDIFEAAGKDPTAVIGSLRAVTHSNFRAGKSKYAIVEACEFGRHFLSLRPTVLVITNIEADHLDYYTDLADIERAFHELALQVAEDGYIVADTASPSVQNALKDVPRRVVDYRKHIDLTVPMRAIGMHNRVNAAAARAVAKEEGIPDDVAARAAADFRGTWRRFEHKGSAATGARVYDDYAHHPTEICATLKATREQFPGKKIIVAFHPHLYSRTKLLFNDFANAFEDADEVMLAPIYAAREVDDGSMSSDMLAEAIRKTGKHAIALPDFEKIAEMLVERSDANTIIVTMGAGDIFKVADMLVGAHRD
jgi:UDP-N-acetylmuramate--alanine ligase